MAATCEEIMTVAESSTPQPDVASTKIPAAGHPTEQLEIEEPVSSDPEVVYPTGAKLWSTVICLCLSEYIGGLDLTIVAVAVPPLTDHFKTVADIGWYSAAYGMTGSSFIFFFGKLYTVFSSKTVYLTGLVIFELGSLVCTVAPTSHIFVLGRAIAGFGSGMIGGGMLKILKDLFPMHKQALWCGIVFGCQAVGLVSAPLVGGILIEAFSWRGCFGVNLPLGVACIAFSAWSFQNPTENEDIHLPLKEKLKRIDLVSTAMIVPSITCLLIALQWGGVKYGWKDPRIISLFLIFVALAALFGYYQYRLGDKAMVPPRIVKQRNLLGASWFSLCCNGILAMTEYYMSIYYQGVRGFSPFKSGLLGLPMIAGLMLASFAAAAGTTAIGYFFRKFSPSIMAPILTHFQAFLFATSILAPIASGLLTTVNLDESIVKPAALLGLLGVAIGLGIQAPLLAVQSSFSAKDVPIGGAVASFAGGLGSAAWICISATMFQNRLTAEIHQHSASTNITMLEEVGLSGIRNYIGSDKLRDVLAGYNQAVVQTLYLPLALTVLTLVGALTMDRKSLKKKTS